MIVDPKPINKKVSTTGDCLAEALQILKKFGEINISTGHDVIYFGVESNYEIPKQDIKRLKELCHYDSTSESFYVNT